MQSEKRHNGTKEFLTSFFVMTSFLVSGPFCYTPCKNLRVPISGYFLRRCWLLVVLCGVLDLGEL